MAELGRQEAGDHGATISALGNFFLPTLCAREIRFTFLEPLLFTVSPLYSTWHNIKMIQYMVMLEITLGGPKTERNP